MESVDYTSTDAELVLGPATMKCIAGATAYVCSGAANPAMDVTQTLTFAGPITSGTTTPGFGISTGSGDAIDINVTNGDGSFTDNYASSITGAVNGISINNTGTGAVHPDHNGPCYRRGRASGILATMDGTATNLTINAASVSGSNRLAISAITTALASLLFPSAERRHRQLGRTAIGVYAKNGPTATDLSVTAHERCLASIEGHLGDQQRYSVDRLSSPRALLQRQRQRKALDWMSRRTHSPRGRYRSPQLV